jgi:hypothetical protein
MATWPATLPAPSLNTLTDALPENRIRTQMDKGPDKVRRRTTANTAPLSFTLKLTTAQWNTLKTFYNTTLYSGVDTFDINHPADNSAITCRFVEPPSRTDMEGILWNVPINLEIMP